MLQKDYILQIVSQFSGSLERWLKPAVLDADLDAVAEVEAAVAALLDLDRATALALDSFSLVTMMELSGIADSVAGYVSYALLRLGDAYEAAGNAGLADVRRDQARAIAEAFGATLGEVPEEYLDLERSLCAE